MAKKIKRVCIVCGYIREVAYTTENGPVCVRCEATESGKEKPEA